MTTSRVNNDRNRNRNRTNTVTGNHEDILGNVTFKGNNCELVLKGNVDLSGLSITFHKDNSKVIIGAGGVIKGQIHLKADCTEVNIGDNLICNSNVFINLAEHNDCLTIGSDCLFANVKFRTSDSHQILDIETGKRLNPSGNITIDDHVWIAEDVLVLKGTHVASGSVIGAKSLVNSLISENCVAVGIPAKIKKRNIRWK